MSYFVTAYRWGNTNESFSLFSSDSFDECADVARYYPDYRGGKYGCAVFKSPSLKEFLEDEYKMVPLLYVPSMLGEEKPSWNHRCDVFNRTVCAIYHHDLYDNMESQWVKDIIEHDVKMADKMNERNSQ